MKTLGIYVHIPFCRSKCPYCDFYSLTDIAKTAAYVQALEQRVQAFFAENDCKADTLYIGGGTPSVLSGAQIASLIKSVQKACRQELCEVTIECNPSDVTEPFLEEVFAAGANRLSFGMQSAVESERKALGRRADQNTVERAVKSAQRIGFNNLSLDLMLGVPAQTKQTLEESIRFCAAAGVQHVSAYLLKLEEGTWYYRNREKLPLPDEDAAADLYLAAVEQLEHAGFFQYEISNFAKPGCESRHNLKYWRLEDYLGIGAAAHSMIDKKRFYYPRDIDYFLQGGAPIADGAGGTLQEKIMLGLRLREGIALSLLSERARGNVPFLCAQGYARVQAGALSLTPQGFLISNAIIHTLTEDLP